jgi:hypothetical protein
MFQVIIWPWYAMVIVDPLLLEFCVVMPSGFTKALKLVECVEMPTHGDVGMVCWG